MKKRVLLAFASTVSLSILYGITAFAAPVTESQAKDTLNPYLPTGSTFLYSEIDDGVMELKYTNDTAQEGYKWKLGLESGQLVSFESEKYTSRGGTKTSISQDDAKQQVTREISNAQILSTRVDYDDDVEYEVSFKTDSYYGTYSIHPETGAILEREIKFTTWKEGTSSNQIITRDKAMEIAKKQVPNAVVTDVDLDWEQSIYCYEVELYKEGTEYTVLIHASTGAVISSYWDSDDWHSSKQEAEKGKDIGIDKAKQIAQKLVPGGTITKCQPDHDDGRFIYEVEIIKDRWEYDIEIDGFTGQVLKNEKDYDD